jgi:maltose alpha-D-glucosyltransferase/alpha-amylase
MVKKTIGDNMKKTDRKWIKDAVIYQIYPQSYYDSNNDGIGDLPGIIKKLDYIKSIGVNLIWLNPCFDSPFMDAGYDVKDFYKIAPRYGTNKDMEKLFTEAHKRDLRVCLDLVAGHTSVECEWFKKSGSVEENEYSDYYLWTDHWCNTPEYGKWINGHAQRNGNFMINFFWSQPALNYGFAKPDPEKPWEEPVDGKGPSKVIAELKNVMKFWLDMGCDGFRVDMAASLIKNDFDKKAVTKLWKKNLHPWIRNNYPHVAMIAEWGCPTEAIDKAGFDIDFLLHCGVPGYGEMFFNHPPVCGRPTDGNCFFAKDGKGSPSIFLKEYFKHFKKIKGKGFISIPTANHDFQRMNWDRDIEELKLIYAFIFTWPGTPSLYYGDEIGMRFIPDLPSKEGGYTRTGARTPMQWNKTKNSGFSKAAPSKLYLPVDSSKDSPSVLENEKDEDSLLNHIRKLLALRQSEPALRNDGKTKILYAKDGKSPLVYSRKNSEVQYLTALNPSSKSKKISIDLKAKNAEAILSSKMQILLKKGKATLEMDGVSWGIYKLS